MAKSVQNNKYLRVELQSGVIVVLKRKGVNGDGTIDISVSTKKVRESTRLKDQKIHFTNIMEA